MWHVDIWSHPTWDLHMNCLLKRTFSHTCRDFPDYALRISRTLTWLSTHYGPCDELARMPFNKVKSQSYISSVLSFRVPVKCERKRNKSKRNKTDRKETKRNDTKRNETNQNERKQIEIKRIKWNMRLIVNLSNLYAHRHVKKYLSPRYSFKIGDEHIIHHGYSNWK